MISEGSCDSEDWSNDAENKAFITAINYISKFLKTENRYFNFFLNVHFFLTILPFLQYF